MNTPFNSDNRPDAPVTLKPFDDPYIDLIPGSVALANLTKEQANDLGQALSKIDPWARMNYSPDLLTHFLKTEEDALFSYAILADDKLAGVVVIRYPWLHGPYLNLLAVLPDFQARGIGTKVLQWMEREVQDKSRNLWVIASHFNTEAIRFYERHGFTQTTEFKDLVKDGFTEVLFRKTLF